MKTSIGDLVHLLYAEFQRQYHDPDLAALATDVVVNDLISAEVSRKGRGRPTNHHHGRRAQPRAA